MLTRFKRIVGGVFAAAVMTASSVTASADYTYQLSGDGLCDEIKAGTKEIDGDTGSFVTEFGDSTEEKFLSLRFKLFNEFLDPEFWNNENVTVSIEARLDTEGADVIGCLPGFNSVWSWITPSDYTPLVYGEWVTISETGQHFYKDFAQCAPAYILFQARTNWGSDAQGEVKISVRNFTISDGTTTVAVTEPPVENTTVSEPEVSEPVESDTEVSSSAESSSGEAAVTEPTESDSEPSDTGSDVSRTESTVASTTTIVTAATSATSAPINYNDYYQMDYETESPTVMILIIVGVAAVVVGGAVVGYIIYKKKKYY